MGNPQLKIFFFNFDKKRNNFLATKGEKNGTRKPYYLVPIQKPGLCFGYPLLIYCVFPPVCFDFSTSFFQSLVLLAWMMGGAWFYTTHCPCLLDDFGTAVYFVVITLATIGTPREAPSHTTTGFLQRNKYTSILWCAWEPLVSALY